MGRPGTRRGRGIPRGAAHVSSPVVHDGFASGTDDEGYDEPEAVIVEEPAIQEPELDTPEEREKFYQEVRRIACHRG